MLDTAANRYSGRPCWVSLEAAEGEYAQREPAYTACGATMSSGVMDSGRLIFIWGTGILGIQESTEPIKTRIPKLVRGLPKGTLVRMVACGWEGHCFLVTRAGELWAWGSGDRGKRDSATRIREACQQG